MTIFPARPSAPHPVPARWKTWQWTLPALFGATMIAAPVEACTVTPHVVGTLGSYSPAAVHAGVVPALRSDAGIACGSAVLSLLGSNRLKAGFHSLNNLKLVNAGGTASIAYAASADAGGAAPFAQDGVVDYMQNNLLNLLDLLGNGNAGFPLYVRPLVGPTIAPGVYRDTITILWDWKQCTGGVELLGACVGFLNIGHAPSDIIVTLIVTPQSTTLTIRAVTTWDPVNQTNRPRAIPGSRNRSAISVTNPDIVPLDAGTIALVLPTPGGAHVALDGDGATAGPAIRLVEGFPASGLSLRYNDPGDISDDVDFSADGGTTWTYAPLTGNAASEQLVTHVRLRPQGTMAAQSNFSVAVPYGIR